VTTLDASHDYWSNRDEVLPANSRVQAYEVLNTREAGDASRNRFLHFLLLNVALWPILIFVGLQVSASHSPGAVKSLIASTGVQSMTADQLVATVNHQGRPVFWLNRISGDAYSYTTAISGVDIISYRPEGAVARNLDQSDLIITTHRDSFIYDAQLRPLDASAPLTVETLSGLKVTYNPSAPDHSVVYFDNQQQVVTIQYPENQKISTLINDAQNLVPIS
jgi:hypothetical protein